MVSILQSIGSALAPIMKGDWEYGPLGCYGDCEDCGSVPCKTVVIGGGMVQFGMTAHALGDNCLTCACYYCCCPCCAAFSQRGKIRAAKGIAGNPVTDLALACCCNSCVVLQNANQVGEAACFTSKKFSTLMAPPTKEDMDRMAAETKNQATVAATEAKAGTKV